ncbi:HypC/HybG/HupF family hydrogenase formation chaperone [Telmatospirillum sp. J64-1]|uniref:HypC/HybG/HupF family hydrogenase formation chaperone n=1 Tax=Telmatospirillum sp. J64-1 TaxID=2502183 RepID=UPI00115EEAB9|nr:HypC/HybG/HupF family hydrogenase formation chaperone [Telmatospirillum sp. J64-1]
MCIGIPMRILSAEGLLALCEGRNGARQQVDLSLTGPQAAGTWLLVHLDTARSVMTAEEARRVADALEAIEAVQQGRDIDHLFADLVEREPELPDFLREAK